jgi:hypothetical protein
MPRKGEVRYTGWVVCKSDLAGKDRRYAKAQSEAEARQLVRQLNAQAGPGVLFWCEVWQTSSSLADGPAWFEEEAEVEPQCVA